jgi:hypothetical protein
MTSSSEMQLPHHTEKVKCLYLAAEDPGIREIEYYPCFHAEARIDFNDVRTGLRETVSISKAMEIYSTGAELLGPGI